jgi:hypothetical protein
MTALPKGAVPVKAISLLNEIRFGSTHVIGSGAALLDRYSELLASPLTIRF